MLFFKLNHLTLYCQSNTATSNYLNNMIWKIFTLYKECKVTVYLFRPAIRVQLDVQI